MRVGGTGVCGVNRFSQWKRPGWIQEFCSGVLGRILARIKKRLHFLGSLGKTNVIQQTDVCVEVKRGLTLCLKFYKFTGGRRKPYLAAASC